MVSFTSIVVAATALVGALAMPTQHANNTLPGLRARAGSPNQTGTKDGYYYSFWSNGQGDVIYTNMAGGKYEVQWSGEGDFTSGKGWQTGSARNINFNAQYYPGNQGGGGSLAVYGWTTNPLIEYYIMENYPSPPTSGLTFVGTVQSDGSNYNIYKHQQVNQPSIVSGSSTFMQYISIRQSPRSSGTVTTGTHFNAWKSHGMNLGQWNVQIVSTEAYGGGQGASTVTVS